MAALRLPPLLLLSVVAAAAAAVAEAVVSEGGAPPSPSGRIITCDMRRVNSKLGGKTVVESIFRENRRMSEGCQGEERERGKEGRGEEGVSQKDAGGLAVGSIEEGIRMVVWLQRARPYGLPRLAQSAGLLIQAMLLRIIIKVQMCLDWMRGYINS